MNVVSSNLANVNTTRTPEGGPYRKKEVIVSATDAKNKFGQELTNSLNGKLKEAKVSDVVERRCRLDIDTDYRASNRT